MSSTDSLEWSLVVPVKVLARAKSRLAAGTGPYREPLALALATDTVAAALTCARVRGVIVVTDDPIAAPELSDLGAQVVPDEPGSGLNPALAHGAVRARLRDPDAGVAGMSADLPALRPAELARVLDQAATHAQAFVADSAGTGTTLYAARPGAEFAPAFGRRSRARHRAAGAYEITLDGIQGLRRDVDTVDDLREALELGAGPRTSAAAEVLPQVRVRNMQATVRNYDAETRSGNVLLDDGRELSFDARAFEAGGLRLLRFGQRVNIAAKDGKITVITLSTFPLPG